MIIFMLSFLTFQCCLVLVVAKHFLAPPLKISHKTLMALRLYSRAGRELVYLDFVGCFFCPLICSIPHVSLGAQLLRP